MKIEIVLNKKKERSVQLAQEILHKLKGRGIAAWMEREVSHQPDSAQADLALVLGGDGTILRAARKYSPQGIPLLGINLGQVGFLAELEVGDVDGYIEPLLAGEYQVEERIMLQAIIKSPDKSSSYLALNDVVIRAKTARVVELEVSINQHFLGRFRGDGVITATPTGSTGYSLAAGGPVLLPGVEALVITPINPFVLSARPLLVSTEKNIKICLVSTRPVVFTVDGQLEVCLSPGDKVELTRASSNARFIKFKNPSLSQLLAVRLSQQGGD